MGMGKNIQSIVSSEISPPKEYIKNPTPIGVNNETNYMLVKIIPVCVTVIFIILSVFLIYNKLKHKKFSSNKIVFALWIIFLILTIFTYKGIFKVIFPFHYVYGI